MAKEERQPVVSFLINQAAFFARNANDDADRVTARKIVVAMRDNKRLERLLEGVEV